MGKKDALIRKYFSNDERFADLWNGYCGKQLLEADKLINMEPHGIQKRRRDNKLKEMEHDILKESCRTGMRGIFGIENQEVVDYRMVLRSLSYTLDAYERQVESLQDKHKRENDLSGAEYLSGISRKDRLYPVAILVVYFGVKSWNGARELYDLLNINKNTEEYRSLYYNYQINLLDVHRFQHIERFKTDIRLVFGFLQCRLNKKKLKEFIKDNEKEFRCMREDAYDVIQACGNISSLRKIKDECKVEGGIDMCRAWNEIIKDERKKGEKKGEKRGEKRGEDRMSQLIQALAGENRMEDVVKAAQNKTYRTQLYKMYGIS